MRIDLVATTIEGEGSGLSLRATRLLTAQRPDVIDAK